MYLDKKTWKIAAVFALLIMIISIMIITQTNTDITGYAIKESEYSPFEDYIEEANKRFNIPQELIIAQIKQESNFKASAVSYVGAAGLIQLMPYTAEELGISARDMYKGEEFISHYKTRQGRWEEYELYRENYADELEQKRDTILNNPKYSESAKKEKLTLLDSRFDPEINIEAGVKYLSQQINYFDGDVMLGLAAYNTGAGNVNKACCVTRPCKTFFECKANLLEEPQKYVTKIMGYYQGDSFIEDVGEDSEELDERKKLLPSGEKIGSQTVYPSFTTKIDYNFKEYDKLKLMIFDQYDGLMKKVSDCKQTSSLADCLSIHIPDSDDFIWKHGSECMSDEEKIFSSFIENYGSCDYSPEDECSCPQIDFPEILADRLTLKIKITESQDEEGNHIINFDTLDLEENLHHELKGMLYAVSDQRYYCGAGDSIEYSIEFNNKRFKDASADFKCSLEEGKLDGIFFEKSLGFAPFFLEEKSGLVECSLKSKKYIFCVQSTKNKIPVYDIVTKKVEEKPVTYRFALDFS